MKENYLSKLATKEQKAYKDGYKKGFTDGEKGLSELLYFLRCNMTNITRYVRLESGSKYNEKYKALADTAVSNILEIINKQEKNNEIHYKHCFEIADPYGDDEEPYGDVTPDDIKFYAKQYGVEIKQ